MFLHEARETDEQVRKGELKVNAGRTLKGVLKALFMDGYGV